MLRDEKALRPDESETLLCPDRTRLEDEEDDDDDDEITETELAQQHKQMEMLLAKKMELEAKLRRVEMETSHLESENQRLMKEGNLMLRNNHEDDTMTLDRGEREAPSVLDRVITEETNMEEYMEELRNEIQKGGGKIQELQDLAEWYDAIRSTMEALSGMRVLDVSNTTSSETTDANGGLTIVIQLLDEYTLQLQLTPSAKKRKRAPSSPGKETREHFRVAHATLKGNLLIGDGPVQGKIPPLDDLVEISRQLPEREDLRFIIRETTARIRAVKSRVDELVMLRKKYAITIENGGEKIFCSLNEGVTAIMRLSADCPMVRLVKGLLGLVWRFLRLLLTVLIVLSRYFLSISLREAHSLNSLSVLVDGRGRNSRKFGQSSILEITKVPCR